MKLYQKIVYNQIKKESRVIDLGCGDGVLLQKLIKSKDCDGYGIEQNFNEVLMAMGRGIPVYQGDVLDGLKQFESGSFDGMHLRAMENTEWSELSESLQHRLLKEVKQMV